MTALSTLSTAVGNGASIASVERWLRDEGFNLSRQQVLALAVRHGFAVRNGHIMQPFVGGGR